MTNVYFNLNQMQHPCRRTMVGWTGTPSENREMTERRPSENREMTEPRECGLTHDHHGTISYAQPNHTPTQSGRESAARVAKYVAMIFAVLVMSMANIGMAWGVDFNVDIDQIRVLPTRSAFVQISAGSNATVSSGKLSIANSKTGTFTIASTIPATYKIKSIAISVSRNVTGFTCTDGGTLSGSKASWTFTPTEETPVGSASFSLNNTSGGAANMTFVVTMTTAETITVEELKTFSFSDPNFSFTSSAATSQVTIKNKANASASSNCINLSKSSNERSITIAAKTGYNLKFISFYYYDAASAPSATPSVTTYTASTHTWIPSSTATSVDFSFNASSAGIKIWKIYVGYETAASCDAADLAAANITSNGDQEAGTGITFSKVGTPASGDTWYWQTSATGTDKTYNATSPYTTATTAGSYTIYLRAFNTDCWGEAASMTNTIYPAPSAMIHNTFAVNAAWGSTIATQDKTNITSLNAMAAVGESVGTGSNKEGLTQKIPSQSPEDASKYMSLSFNVASGKQLNVTSVVFDEQPVTGTGTFKVSISDNQGSATKTQTIASGAAGSKHTLTLDGDIVGSFKGTVTVKVWAYGWGDGYRFGDYFYINGTVTATAPSCTAPTSPSISGTTEYTEGQDISLTASASDTDGSTTYTWYKGEDWATASAGSSIGSAATFTKNSCGEGDAGTYWCNISNGTGCEVQVSLAITVAPAACSAFEFHYGTHNEDDWETACFEQVGETSEWQIENFTIPSTPNFYVGYHGDGIGGWNSDWSAEKAWTDVLSDGNGAMALLPSNGNQVGQATGATGTLSIWSDSNDKNKYVGFKPDGYGIMYGGNSYAFSETATDNMLETDVVTLPDVSTTYQMGIKTASGYTTCAHSSAAEALSNLGVTEIDGGKRKIYLYSTSDSWIGSNAKMAIYDYTDDRGFWGDNTDANKFMTKLNDNLWVGYVQNDATNIILVRVNPESADPGWGWGQSHDITLSSLNNYFTITGTWSASKAEYTVSTPHPATGDKGKYRMWATSTSSNWFVHWIPYYVLSYDANGGTGTTSATERSSESSTTTVTIASNGFTAPTGHEFAGWNTADDGKGTSYAAGADYTLAANATLYAQWTPKSYDVSTSLTNVTVASGTTGENAATYGTAYSLTLSGLTGYNLPATVTVTIEGETATPTTDYAWNSSTGVLTILAAKVTGTISISATGVAKTYSITLDDNGDYDGNGSAIATYASNKLTDISEPARDGYSIAGYYAEAECTNLVADASGNLESSVTISEVVWTDASGNWKKDGSVTLYAKWTFIPVLTAMSADVLYQAADMANIIFTGSDQPFTGLSTNNLFKVYGATSPNVAAKGKNEDHNVADDISTKNFTSALYILSNSNTTSTDDPTEGAIEIITPSTAGLLYLYMDADNSSLTLKKQGTSTSTSLSGATYKAMSVDANTHYFINGSSSGKRGLYGILYVSTYAVDYKGCSNVTQVTGEVNAIKGKTYTATFTANSGYRLPSDATVKIGGVTQTKETDYNWTISDGTATLTIPAAKVTDAIVIDVDGEQVYELTVVVNTEGYGKVSPTSVLVPATGLETSSSSNTFTVNGTTVIATPTASTVEYTYAFDSWSGLPATVTASATVTANFTRTAVNYTLTWDANRGDELTGEYTSGTVAYGTTIVAPNDPTRDGYDFAGWDVDPAATMPAANTTYTAQWAQKFTVTYDAVGGTCATASAQGSSENPVTLPTPTKAGYEFQGWYVAGVKIGDAGAEYTPTADVTAYARWKAECDGGEEITWDFTNLEGQEFTANTSYSFSANDGVTEMRYSAGKDDKIVAKDGSTDGYLKENGKTGSGTVYDIDGETNVGKTRLIRLFVTGSGKLTINCNETNGLYKVLNGSASGSTLIEALSANTQSSVINVTTSPIWIETTTKGYITTILWSPQSCYYITYDGNGADGGYTGDEEAYAANDDPVVKTNGFTKYGYAFVGWNTAADGSGTAYAEGATITDISADVTLYAQWAEITTFNGNVLGHETEWGNTANWSGGALPTINNAVVIENKDIIVNVGDAQAATVILSGTSTLTVQANKALVVDGKITKNGTAPTASDLVLESTSDGNATLIFDNSNSAAATVQMYSKATADGGWTWQYIAAPAAVSALDNYYGGYLYKWVESSWAAVGRDATMELFAGYCVSYPTAGHTFAIEGTLAPTTSKSITVPAGKSMVVGNSWTAPIQIGQLENADFGDLEKSVYFYNTGNDENNSGSQDIHANPTGDAIYAAGTYISVPIHSAPYVGVSVISSLQGFFVKNNTGSETSLSLSYSKHVRPSDGNSVVNGAMHAPKRVADETDRPAVLKMKVSGSQYDDRLILLEREDFTTGYDAGWDGDKMGDVATSPRITTTREDGTADAVAALPDLEGTLINFRAASTDDQYTLYFDYEAEDAEPLYLLDLTNNAYTRVETGSSYTFFTTDKADHKRFALTRYRAPQITTGVEDALEDNGQGKAVKFIENDKLYILRNGVLYDGTGKKVIEN